MSFAVPVNIARNRNQTPTAIRMRPPHRLTVGPAVLKRLSVDACANAAPSAAMNKRMTIMVAAMENVKTEVAMLPAMRD